MKLIKGRIRIRRDSRIGRTKDWRAVVLWLRYHGRINGLWLRLGDTAVYVALVPRPTRSTRPGPDRLLSG